MATKAIALLYALWPLTVAPIPGGQGVNGPPLFWSGGQTTLDYTSKMMLANILDHPLFITYLSHCMATNALDLANPCQQHSCALVTVYPSGESCMHSCRSFISCHIFFQNFHLTSSTSNADLPYRFIKLYYHGHRC
jgi:hypothetical protein